MSGVATAIIGSAVIGGVVQSKASKRAVGAQTEASDAAIAQQESSFNRLQTSLKPYTEGGGQAFAGLLDMMGASGPEAEQAQIAQIEGSPEFKALIRQGEQGILQSASATGDLRGGNVKDALSKYRPQVLSGLINERFNRFLQGSQFGQSSAAGVGTGALQTGQGISKTLINRGEAIGQGAIARGNQTAGLISAGGQALGQYFGSRNQAIPEMSVTF